MAHELELPEGFAFGGTMQFVEAKVEIDPFALAEVFETAFEYFMGSWIKDEDVTQEDYPHVAVTINGTLVRAMIVDMNQVGQLILLVHPDGHPEKVLGLKGGAQYFYIRTRQPDSNESNVVPEQGVMIHDYELDPDGPTFLNHAYAVMAFSFLRLVK